MDNFFLVFVDTVLYSLKVHFA